MQTLERLVLSLRLGTSGEGYLRMWSVWQLSTTFDRKRRSFLKILSYLLSRIPLLWSGVKEGKTDHDREAGSFIAASK